MMMNSSTDNNFSISTTTDSAIPCNWTLGNETLANETLVGQVHLAAHTEPGISKEHLFVHKFWDQFQDQIRAVPDFVYFGFGIYITIICVVGIIGNGTVIAVFIRSASLRTPSNAFIINLAVSDLAFAAVNGFPLMTIACFKKRWPWGATACQWYAYISGITGLTSINTLAFISLDRFLVIAKPFHMMRVASNRRSIQQLVFIWSWALLWSTPPMLGWGRYIYEGLQVSCTFDYLSRTTSNIAFNYCLFGLGFLTPVIIIVISYAGIVISVSKQSRNLDQACNRMGAQRSAKGTGLREAKVELQLSKVVAATVCMFIFSWLPYALIAQLAINGHQRYVTPYTTELPVMFAKASAMWNPIIYALSHPRYKMELRRILPVWAPFRRQRGSLPTHHSSRFSRINLEIVDNRSTKIHTVSDLQMKTF